MSGTRDQDRDDADLAAEYVLGVLDGASRRAVEHRVRHDRAFAGEVEAWTARLAPLALAIPEETPPPHVWQQVSRDLDRITRAAPRRPVAEAPRTGRRVSAIWQWWALAASGLAVAALAGLIVLSPIGRPWLGGFDGATATIMTATLASDTGTPLYTVVIDTSDNTATLIPVASADGEGRVPELWLISPDFSGAQIARRHRCQPAAPPRSRSRRSGYTGQRPRHHDGVGRRIADRPSDRSGGRVGVPCIRSEHCPSRALLAQLNGGMQLDIDPGEEPRPTMLLQASVRGHRSARTANGLSKTSNRRTGKRRQGHHPGHDGSARSRLCATSGKASRDQR